MLSNATPEPKPLVEVTTTNLATSAIVVSTGLTQSTTSPMVGPIAPGLGDDSFLLDSGDDMPQVRIALLLSPTSPATTGQLLVATGSGGLDYSIPLTDVLQLHAELPEPSDSGTTATLGIDLAINRSNSTPNAPGSFQLAVYWNQDVPATDALHFSTPQNLPTAPSMQPPFNPVLFGSPTTQPSPSYPWISITENLPTPTNSIPRVEPKADGGTIPLPGLPQSTSPHASGLVTLPTTSHPQNATPTVALSLDGLATMTADGRNGRPANVGPLPLSGPSPDGGIFAFPNDSSKAADPVVQPTNTLQLAPVVTMNEELPRPWVRAIRQFLSLGASLPRLSRNSEPRLARPTEIDPASETAQSAPFALPPLAGLAALGRNQLPERRPGWHETPGTVASSSRACRPGAVLASTLIATTSLLFGLFAPDCITRLALWQAEEPPLRRRFKPRGIAN